MELYTLALTASGALLIWKVILSPTVEYYRWKNQREFLREYRFFMLSQVKKHYPFAEELSMRELQENFNIIESFDRLGKVGYPLSRKPTRYTSPLSPAYVPRNAFYVHRP